jgi:hypothetical protein
MHHCFATPDSFQAALDGMAGEELNAKGQEFMATGKLSGEGAHGR